MKYLGVFILAYLIGSIMNAYIIGKIFYDKDIRKIGTKNAGTANSVRQLGTIAGAMVMLLDILKGFIAAYIGNYYLGKIGAELALLGVLLGHNYPIFLMGRGGKGIAAVAGSMLVLSWQSVFTYLAVFFLALLLSKIVTLSAISGFVAAPFIVYYWTRDWELVFFVSLMALQVIYMHKHNIRAIKKKEEPSFNLVDYIKLLLTKER